MVVTLGYPMFPSTAWSESWFPCSYHGIQLLPITQVGDPHDSFYCPIIIWSIDHIYIYISQINGYEFNFVSGLRLFDQWTIDQWTNGPMDGGRSSGGVDGVLTCRHRNSVSLIRKPKREKFVCHSVSRMNFLAVFSYIFMHPCRLCHLYS